MSLPLLPRQQQHPPDYYIALLEKEVDVDHTSHYYSSGTLKLLGWIERQWNGQSVGTDGKRRRGIKQRSTLETYWKLFRLVYEMNTSERLDGKLSRQMHKVGDELLAHSFKLTAVDSLRELAIEHGLSDTGSPKTPMDHEDLLMLLQTNLTTTEHRYRIGRLRIQLHLFLQIALITAARPQAILNLCYRHLRIYLLRDPEGGRPRLFLGFTFEFTKTYLGLKEA
ncbi:hypothetical protein BDV96DRAFT_655764 [Lophiotrema nucula]|uniref:Uncharacterized protein n=1 Tax=Lophiotrema nucula TaxID=690887 RepID=A0A6A5YDX6_9PLEO|nr:hypothetical protein BDV96DRAFT_655764 [Lophiotrema nucula]